MFQGFMTYDTVEKVWQKPMMANNTFMPKRK